jgi:hypothetical protein
MQAFQKICCIFYYFFVFLQRTYYKYSEDSTCSSRSSERQLPKMFLIFLPELKQGFFSQAGKAAQPLILRKNYMVYLQKGEKKLDVNSIFAENCLFF